MHLINTSYHPRFTLPVFLLTGALLGGCATMTGEDPTDPCGTARAELRNSQNYYLKAVATGALQGAALGAITGAIGAAITGKDPTKGALIGGAAGGVIGGIGGYYQAKQQLNADAATLSSAVLNDVMAENGEIDKASVAFAQLRDCRFAAAQQIKADYRAGRISRAQAAAGLDDLRRRFDEDLVIADQVGAKMAEHSREFQYASEQLIAGDPEARAYLKKHPVVKTGTVQKSRKASSATSKKAAASGQKAKSVPKAKSAKPASKAPPAVQVAQETNTNQDKQKKYADDVALAKSQAGKEFALEGKVSLLSLPECAACTGT